MSEEKQEEIQNENCQCEEVKDNTALNSVLMFL